MLCARVCELYVLDYKYITTSNYREWLKIKYLIRQYAISPQLVV